MPRRRKHTDSERHAALAKQKRDLEKAYRESETVRVDVRNNMAATKKEHMKHMEGKAGVLVDEAAQYASNVTKFIQKTTGHLSICTDSTDTSPASSSDSDLDNPLLPFSPNVDDIDVLQQRAATLAEHGANMLCPSPITGRKIPESDPVLVKLRERIADIKAESLKLQNDGNDKGYLALNHLQNVLTNHTDMFSRTGNLNSYKLKCKEAIKADEKNLNFGSVRTFFNVLLDIFILPIAFNLIKLGVTGMGGTTPRWRFFAPEPIAKIENFESAVRSISIPKQ